MNPSILPATFAPHWSNDESDNFYENTGMDSNHIAPHLNKSPTILNGYQLKSVLLIVFIFTSLMANAQFKRGDKFVGGYFTISDQNSSDENGVNISTTKSKSFSLSPFVGFFLNDAWAIGGFLGYSTNYYQSINSPMDTYTSKGHSFSFGIFGRRYLAISDKFFFVVHGESSFSRGSQTRGNGSVESYSKNYYLGVYIRPMFVFFPSPKWGLEGGLGSVGFTHSRDLSTDAKGNSYDLSYGGLLLGITYYLYKSE